MRVWILFGPLREIVLPRGSEPDAEQGSGLRGGGDDTSPDLNLRLYQNQYFFQILNKSNDLL